MPAVYRLSSPARIIVPSVRMRNVLVPPPVRELTRRGFADSAWMADIDNNELLPCDPHAIREDQIPRLSGANLETVVSFLQLGGKTVYITGSMFEHQEARTIVPIRQKLAELDKLYLMPQVALYANRGASCGWYQENGQRDEELYRKYVATYGLSKEIIDAVESAAQEAIGVFLARFNKERDEFLRLYPDYVPDSPPIFQIRDACQEGENILGAPQVAMLPFPGDEELGKVVQFMKQKLSPDVLHEISMTPGGRSTVDINRAGVSKATAFEHYLRTKLQIPIDPIDTPMAHPVPYSGDETQRTLTADGGEKRGGDTFPLEIPNCFVLGFDQDPQRVIQVPGRSFYVGRGPVANLALRQWIVRNWKKDTLEPEVTVPFMEPGAVSVPDAVMEAIAGDFKNVLVATSGSLITGFLLEKDIKSTKVDPTILQIALHLILEKPFLIISNGDYTTRLRPSLDALRKVLGEKKDEEFHHLLAFSNGGVVKVQFSDDGEEMISVNADKIIAPDDLNVLTDIAQQLIREYGRHFGNALSVPPVLQKRKYQEQVLQLSILPFERRTRGWMQMRFKELAAQAKLDPKYSGQFGGYSFDIGRASNTKPSCLEEGIRHFNLAPAPDKSKIIYFGGQFFSDVDVTAATVEGVDMTTLKLANVIPIALNDDQGTVPVHERIVAGGSGGEAFVKWLELLHNPLKVLRE